MAVWLGKYFTSVLILMGVFCLQTSSLSHLLVSSMSRHRCHAAAHQLFGQALGFPTRCTLSVGWLMEEPTCLNKMWMHHMLKYNVTTPHFLESGCTTWCIGQKDDHHMHAPLDLWAWSTGTASPLLGCAINRDSSQVTTLIIFRYLLIYRRCKIKLELRSMELFF